ncbi:MAG: chemotaxis protein CheW [Desulfuromonadaceae bacterium]|nr:chemotaxis protein CheW [Desulfuromonadaceae bacterium]MDD5105722.1 chemotaxis protein CheW [Desulfuromonadaceae bacterium]
MLPFDVKPKSEHVVDELKKRQRTKEIVDVEEERVKVVIFMCSGNRYAFYGADIREILPACDICWVPCLPEYIPGLINVRGDIESVIDISYFFGEELTDQGTRLIAMAVRGDFHSGVIIDAIQDVVDIPLSTIQPPLATLNGAARDLVIGEIAYAGETISLLDVGKLAALIAL